MKWRAIVHAEFTRHGKSVDDTIVEELAQHAADAWEAARADGESPDAADARVLALIESWCRATSGPRRIDRAPLVESAFADGRRPLSGLGLDVRMAFRMIARQPAFAAVSIVLIALAVAAATSLFSVVNGVLLRPLPWAKVDGLVRVFETGRALPLSQSTPVVTNFTYRTWADDHPQTIDGLGGWSDSSMSLDGPSGIELVSLARTTASLFPLLGVRPLLGVSFTDADERTDDNVILSYGFWQERFGGRPDALGQRLTLAGKPRTIVGVMPREFAFPSPETRLWLAERIRSAFLSARDPGPRGETRGLTIGLYNAVARLKPAVTPEQAASEALARTKAVSPILENGGFAAFANPKVAVVPMLEWLVKDVKPALWMLLTAGVLLFAAAIGNVANMQLVRASSRQREIAIRAAIGAGSGRLVRQLFVETSLIAAIGSAIGLGLTSALLRVLPAALPEDFPRAEDIAIDTRVLMVVTSLAIVVSVVIALLPSRMARRVKLTSALAEDGSAPVGQSLRSPAARARALIITGQVAVAAVLLVGAALLAQSFANQIRVDRGYQPASLLTARLTLIGRGLPAGARPIFFNEVLDRLAATHGVTHAALTSHLPLTPSELPAQIFDGAPKPQGYPPFDRRRMDAMLRIVSPDYFAAMGIRVLRGRGFTNQDVVSSEPVMVVNEAFAKKYFGGQPLDALLFPGDIVNNGDHQIWKVIGVVSDVVHRGATEPIQPEVFATFNQQRGGPYGSQFLTVRTAGDPAALSRELRTIVRGASPNGVLEQVMTMDARVMRSLSRPRLYAALLGGFGSFALLIAAIGLFGGLAYGVTQRTREIGVRTALGATPRDIVELVLRQGLVMTVCGIAIGFGIAASTGRYLSGFLFGVTPANPATFGVVGVALVLVAGIACAIPARRAAKIDAIQALKR